MVKVVETVLYAQYHEALKHAAARGPPTAGGKRTVYMMPLWWRRFFFQNPTGIIVSAMSCAVETLMDCGARSPQYPSANFSSESWGVHEVQGIYAGDGQVQAMLK